MCQFIFQNIPNRVIGTLHQIVNHSLQTHSTSIVWRINSFDSVGLKFCNFCRKNYTTTTTKYLDVSCSFFFKQIVHVFEILVVPTLIRSHGYSICIFLNGSIYYFFHASIVTKMNDFNTCRLDNSTHDVYGSIVTVKKRCSGNNSYFIFRNIGRLWFHW